MTFKYGLMTCAAMLMCAGAGSAQDAVETLDQLTPDILPKPSVHGPMTVVRPAGLLIASFDANRDYMVSRTEFDLGAGKAFENADENSDGNLTLFELEDWRLKALGSLDAMPGNMSFDENYNSRITEQEFLDTLIYEFERADKDDDGMVAFSDLISLVERPPVYERPEKKERESPFNNLPRQRRPGY